MKRTLKKVTFEIPTSLAEQIKRFAEIGGITPGQGLICLLPDMERLLASPDKIEVLPQSEFEFSASEIAQLDQRLAAMQEG
jgi:hypothetical protein